jgi:hypothetical protein
VRGVERVAVRHGAAAQALALALIAVDGSPAWLDGLVYVTVAITVLSGADYFFGLRRLLRSRGSVEPVAHRDVAR